MDFLNDIFGKKPTLKGKKMDSGISTGKISHCFTML